MPSSHSWGIKSPILHLGDFNPLFSIYGILFFSFPKVFNKPIDQGVLYIDFWEFNSPIQSKTFSCFMGILNTDFRGFFYEEQQQYFQMNSVLI